MLSKKHYIEIAKILNKHHNGNLVPLVYDFIDYLERDNPNFDKDKFLKAVKK